MPPAQPWHQDISGSDYKGVSVVERNVGNALVELDVGHYLDDGRLYSRPEYAYRAGRKFVSQEYFVLVKIRERGRIGWAVLILTTTVSSLDL